MFLVHSSGLRIPVPTPCLSHAEPPAPKGGADGSAAQRLSGASQPHFGCFDGSEGSSLCFGDLDDADLLLLKREAEKAGNGSPEPNSAASAPSSASPASSAAPAAAPSITFGTIAAVPSASGLSARLLLKSVASQSSATGLLSSLSGGRQQSSIPRAPTPSEGAGPSSGPHTHAEPSSQQRTESTAASSSQGPAAGASGLSAAAPAFTPGRTASAGGGGAPAPSHASSSTAAASATTSSSSTTKALFEGHSGVISVPSLRASSSPKPAPDPASSPSSSAGAAADGGDRPASQSPADGADASTSDSGSRPQAAAPGTALCTVPPHQLPVQLQLAISVHWKGASAEAVVAMAPPPYKPYSEVQAMSKAAAEAWHKQVEEAWWTKVRAKQGAAVAAAAVAAAAVAAASAAAGGASSGGGEAATPAALRPSSVSSATAAAAAPSTGASVTAATQAARSRGNSNDGTAASQAYAGQYGGYQPYASYGPPPMPYGAPPPMHAMGPGGAWVVPMAPPPMAMAVPMHAVPMQPAMHVHMAPMGMYPMQPMQPAVMVPMGMGMPGPMMTGPYGGPIRRPGMCGAWMTGRALIGGPVPRVPGA